MGVGTVHFNLAANLPRTGEESFPAVWSSGLCREFPLFPFLWDTGRVGEGLGGWGRQTGGVLSCLSQDV